MKCGQEWNGIELIKTKYNKLLILHTSNISKIRLQEHAFEVSQKYKEGKFIIELAHMVKDNGWDKREFKRNNSIN